MGKFTFPSGLGLRCSLRLRTPNARLAAGCPEVRVPGWVEAETCQELPGVCTHIAVFFYWFKISVSWAESEISSFCSWWCGETEGCHLSEIWSFCFSEPHFLEVELRIVFQKWNKSSGLSWSCTCLKPALSSLDPDILCCAHLSCSSEWILSWGDPRLVGPGILLGSRQRWAAPWGTGATPL